MRTLIVSDLHIGSPARSDVLRRSEVRHPLLEAIEAADRVVLLGDVVELRGAPVADCLDRARPVLAEIGAAAGDSPVVVVPGNHDYQLAGEWLEQRRQRSTPTPLGLEQWIKPGRSGLMAKVARALGARELGFAYPGVWLRPDVYATHGHYLDRHNEVPAVEVMAISACARAAGDRAAAPRDTDAYEAAVAPVYAFDYAIAQSGGPSAGAIRRGSSLHLWRRLNPQHGRLTPSRLLLGKVLLPAAIAAANRAGLGPFRSDLTPATLRSAGLRAMGQVTASLGIEADHVVFGHTHRAGPLPDDPDEDGWALAGAARLYNSGNWVYQQALIGSRARRSPYWPGAAVVLEDSGPPRLERLLADIPAAAIGAGD